MKKNITIIFSFAILIFNQTAFSQTTTINYQTASTFIHGCFFNEPTPSIPISGIPHVGVVGGVRYTGNEFELDADVSGNGTGFGIYYQFDQGYRYKVIVNAKSTSTSVKLQWATNSSRTNVPTTCVPGFPNYITSGQDIYGSVTNMTNSYADYTALNEYKPTTTGINYLLFSNYNTATNAPALTKSSIKSVQIITNGCKMPTWYRFTPYGAQKTKVEFTAPLGSFLPITSYSVYALRILTTSTGMPYVPTIITGQYIFNNVTNGQLLSTPFAGAPTGWYIFYFVSNCGTVQSLTDPYRQIVL